MAVDENGEQIIEPTPDPEKSRAQERITQLSEKVKQEAEGRAAEVKLREEAEAKAAESERKAAFADGFSDIIASQPAAKDFKADIQAKVMSGYTVQDATYAVLGAAGKLGNTPAPTPQVAGGSAPNGIQSGQKSVADMTQAERREQLDKDIVWS